MNEAVVHRAGDLGVFAREYLRHRYAILFYTLLLTMVAAPLLATFKLRGAMIEFFVAANLLAAVMPVGSARSRVALLVATAAVGVARPITAWLDHPALSAMTLGLWTLIGILGAAGALRFALRAAHIDTEHLYAALSAYLLSGIFFGLFYWALEQIGPGTFSGGELTRASALYFSFVTLATLGYGDIVPRTDVARGLAIIEGVGGQLFLAVMVARLVSLYARVEPR